jgi:hypothetical protein
MNLDAVLRPTSPLLRSSLFMGAFTIFALFVFAYASYRLDEEMKPLYEKQKGLEEKRDSLKRKTHDLQEKVSSLSDPAADEYALITELGRAPDGSYKILFQEDKVTAP